MSHYQVPTCHVVLSVFPIPPSEACAYDLMIQDARSETRTGRLRIGDSAAAHHFSGRATQTRAVLIKDPSQVHFQWRVCDLEDFTLELAEASGLIDRVGALEIGVQKPDLCNAVGNVIVAALLNLAETVVTDDLDAQERDSRRRFFQT
jgi:hypothetical protein